MFPFVLPLLLQASAVLANTEKIIFLSPSNLHVPVEPPTLGDLRLEALSTEFPSLRTHIRAKFPSNGSDYGQSTWVLLEKLQQGQRYEVRICWAATLTGKQPTSFRLETYELPVVFETPELLTSLAQYSQSRQPNPVAAVGQIPSLSITSSKANYEDVSSILFLHIQAAADYYTTNRTLMEDVPPVFVDVILDSYILNCLPRSLIPTVGYIIILAIGSWYLAKYVSRWVTTLAGGDLDLQKKIS